MCPNFSTEAVLRCVGKGNNFYILCKNIFYDVVLEGRNISSVTRCTVQRYVKLVGGPDNGISLW